MGAKKMKQVRTRFAPSPTGYLHIGGLRTALYAWLYAKKYDGKFILRIEDTDQERFVEGATELIYRTMRETGLMYDEGPDVGGDYGPYIQSERRDTYRQYIDQLIESGGAYYCFCTKEELQQRREAAEKDGGAFRYDGKCKHIPLEEAKRRVAAGEPYVVRQCIPQTGEAGFDDLVFGHISVPVEELEEGILMKSDGLPTYNFANVVDDHLMGITHVIRGMEYLSSTPKYNLLYEALGWEVPTYIHLAPVMRDAQHKLSKRHGDASYEDFINKGYLKDAIINYIALVGWNPGTDQEIFTLDELIDAFDVKGISKSPGIFDVQKLTWMNAEYIRKMDEAAFTQAAMPYYQQILQPDAVQCNILYRVLQPRLEVFTQIPEKIAFLKELPAYDNALYVHKKMKTDEAVARKAVGASYEALKKLTQWTEQSVHDALMQTAQENEMKNGQIFWPVRVAVTGTEVTPGGAIEAAVLLGREETLRRMEHAMAQLAE